MKVIGAGLPRTATLSQKVALEMVGFGPCYHMVNVLGDLSQVPTWQDALAGNADFHEVFAGYEASVDWPGSFFYRELMETFPDAKVFLSKRDGAAWARSMIDTIWGFFWGDSLMTDMARARARVDPGWKAYIEMMTEMWGRIGIDANSTPEDLARVIEDYEDEVVATVPSERLLVWSVADGWERLCEFLEIDVPEGPFPRLNDSAQFAERIIDGALLTIKAWREAADAELAQAR
jgi:Sulfotransferase domain